MNMVPDSLDIVDTRYFIAMMYTEFIILLKSSPNSINTTTLFIQLPFNLWHRASRGQVPPRLTHRPLPYFCELNSCMAVVIKLHSA